MEREWREEVECAGVGVVFVMSGREEVYKMGVCGRVWARVAMEGNTIARLRQWLSIQRFFSVSVYLSALQDNEERQR